MISRASDLLQCDHLLLSFFLNLAEWSVKGGTLAKYLVETMLLSKFLLIERHHSSSLF